MSTAHATSDCIAPERIYPRAVFFSTTGLGLSTHRKYQRLGITLKTLEIGQQILVRGSDGIAWLEAIAQHQAAAASGAVEAESIPAATGPQ